VRPKVKKHGVRGIKLEYPPDYKKAKDMAEGEVQAYLQVIVKGSQKIRRQLFRDIEKVNGATTALAKFAENNPRTLLCKH